MGWLIFIVVTGVVVYWYVADERSKRMRELEKSSYRDYNDANYMFQEYEKEFPSPYSRVKGSVWSGNLIDLFSIDNMEKILSKMIQENEKLRNNTGVYFNQYNLNIEINHYLNIINYS